MNTLSDPLYADTSALVKLVIDEVESESLNRYLIASGFQLTSSVIAEVELLRTIFRVERNRIGEARELLDEMILLPLTTDVKHLAASVKPESVRSLDAIHLATAQEIQADLHALVSYDNRLLEAAGSVGIDTVSPSA